MHLPSQLNRHPDKNHSQVCFDPRQASPTKKFVKGGRKKTSRTYNHSTGIVWTPEECLQSMQSDHPSNPTYLHTHSFSDCGQSRPDAPLTSSSVGKTELYQPPYGVNYGEIPATQPQESVSIANLPPPPYATQDTHHPTEEVKKSDLPPPSKPGWPATETCKAGATDESRARLAESSQCDHSEASTRWSV